MVPTSGDGNDVAGGGRRCGQGPPGHESAVALKCEAVRGSGRDGRHVRKAGRNVGLAGNIKSAGDDGAIALQRHTVRGATSYGDDVGGAWRNRALLGVVS